MVIDVVLYIHSYYIQLRSFSPQFMVYHVPRKASTSLTSNLWSRVGISPQAIIPSCHARPHLFISLGYNFVVGISTLGPWTLGAARNIDLWSDLASKSKKHYNPLDRTRVKEF